MLRLENICKTYKVGEIETKALIDISVAFREREFVAILGSSGSGKTTCLNIIGGLDRYDNGNLIIKGKSTKSFKAHDWDAYRNNSIGFVFQSYNLINHLSIVANVEMGMTLSGVSAKEKRARALEVLGQVGLSGHLHKKPNQLSGGQQQRVAIARALANDPEILLCDEPTGALDSETGRQIIELIKTLSADRLVIMVTHNPALAEQYSDRIIRFSDGRIVSDSNPCPDELPESGFSLKKTAMSFFTALSLSFNNIRTKKGRTFLTAFASSIGIIGIALILSLSDGFNTQINDYQRDALNEFPIVISKEAVKLDREDLNEQREEMKEQVLGQKEYADTDEVELYNPEENKITHENLFTDEYLEYLGNISPDICSSIGYTRFVGMNLVSAVGGDYAPATMAIGMAQTQGMTNFVSMSNAGLLTYPEKRDAESKSYLEENYDVLDGAYPRSETDLVLIIDNRNRIDLNVLKNLGFDTDNTDAVKFADIVGTQLRLIPNDDYYATTQYGTYVPGTDYEGMYNSGDAVTLTLCGVLRQKEDVSLAVLGNGIAYSDDLVTRVIEMNTDSAVVRAQRESDRSVITTEELDADAKKSMLAYLGGDAAPSLVLVYPIGFDSKEQVIDYLESYNASVDEEHVVTYTDLSETVTEMTGSIMDGITIVLIAFAAISLVVSLIMIAIITYTSVLERTKEIGILKALGARKKDITRVFDAETCILGVFSGLLGVAIAWLLTIPTNMILYSLTSLRNVAQLNPLYALLLVAVSTLLTMLGGHIPAKMASKKDAVEALRGE